MEKIYIKNKNMFKNKWQMVIYLIIFLVILGLFIYIGTLDFNEELPDNELFAATFDQVDTDNVFSFKTASEVRNIIANGSGIILFGTENAWVNYYAGIVSDAAKIAGVDKIYYYDFLKNRSDNNGTYEDIVSRLSEYVYYNDRGIAEVYAPTLLVIKDGKVLLFDSETAFVKGSDVPSRYWNSFKRQEKINELQSVFTVYMGG